MNRPLKQLSAVHYRAMSLRNLGQTYKQIGATINRSEGSIRNWFSQDPLFVETFAALRAEAIEQARSMLINAAPDAAQNMIDLQKHKVGVVALGASKDILDRVGLQPTQKHDMTSGGKEIRTFTIKIAGRHDGDGAEPA